MPSHDKTRFRITPFPQTPLPLQSPSLVRGPFRIHQSGALCSEAGRSRSDLQLDEALGEIYLKLIAVDLDDDVDLVSFLDQFGELGVRDAISPLGEATEQPDYRHIIHPAFPGGDETIRELRASVARGGEALGLATLLDAPETRTEFIFGATLMRDLVTAWRYLHEGSQPEAWDWPLASAFGLTPLSEEFDFSELVASYLEAMLTSLLRPFSPQIRLVDGLQPSGLFFGEVSLLSVCALELFNHIAEAAEYRICANEPCGGLFVRQKGRAVHGQHRKSGVKFCSFECARQQTSRNYRRRHRGAGKGSG